MYSKNKTTITISRIPAEASAISEVTARAIPESNTRQEIRIRKILRD